MGLMSARRLVLVAVASLSSLAAGALLGAPAAFAEVCPNEAARGGPSASLPDCRAYEMVTPADKSAIVQDLNFSSGASERAVTAVDGNRVLLSTAIEGYGQTPQPFESTVMFTRTPSGWQTESVNPPDSDGASWGGGYGEMLFTPDLSQVALFSEDKNLFPTTPVQTSHFGPPGGPFTEIAKTPLYNEATSFADWFGGATPDFSSIFIDELDHNLTGSPSGTTVEEAHDIYRWEGGRLSLVNVNADGSPVSACGADFKAVSEDGSKVFFIAPDHHMSNGTKEAIPSCDQPARLYMRDGSSIVEVSKPNPGVVDPDGFKGVEFDGASADGSKVFFTTHTELTKDDEGYHDRELYEYDTVTSTLTRISNGTTGTAAANNEYPGESKQGENGGIRGVLPSTSKDGSRVYFTSGGKLTPNAPAGYGDKLYRYNTETGETHYIIDSADFTYPGSHEAEELEGNGELSFQATPNGGFLAFASSNSEGEYQVYRYDDENGEVTCVSCLPSSAPKDKASEIGEAVFRSPTLYTWDSTPAESEISNDGSYVFFESTTQLVPRAVNVTGGEIFDAQNDEDGLISDVYEWHDGVVSLISSPSDPFPSDLLGASADGSNVFFVSHSQLVPQDIDNSGDIYDARIDGGFPPATEPAACEGDTCLVVPPALNRPTPASSSFTPVSTAPTLTTASVSAKKSKAKSCGKGRMLKKGRCVRKPRAKRVSRRAVKHNRGGSK
jgi:hypothetical protein